MINYAKGSTAQIQGYRRGPAQLPLQWIVDLVNSPPAVGLVIQGKGHPHAVPDAIVALLYGQSFFIDVSISSGSLGASFVDTFNRGETASVSDGEKVITGETVPVESIFEITEFAKRTDDLLSLKPYFTQIQINEERDGGGTNELLLTGLTFDNVITYYAQHDVWAMGSQFDGGFVSAFFFDIGVDDGDSDSCFASLQGQVAVDESINESITICGSPAKMRTSSGVSLTGSIDVISWLPAFDR